MPPLPPPPAPAKSPAGPWVWAFRIVRWTIYAGGLVTLLMLLHKVPAPVVQASPQIASEAQEKIDAVQLAVRGGQPAVLHLSESELNSIVASRMGLEAQPSGAAPGAEEIEEARSNVRDIKLQLEGDSVRAYVLFDFHGKDLTLQLAGKLSSADGFIRFAPTSGALGSFPIPQSALDNAIARLMKSDLNRESFRLPPDVRDLRIVQGEIVVTYR